MTGNAPSISESATGRRLSANPTHPPAIIILLHPVSARENPPFGRACRLQAIGSEIDRKRPRSRRMIRVCRARDPLLTRLRPNVRTVPGTLLCRSTITDCPFGCVTILTSIGSCPRVGTLSGGSRGISPDLQDGSFGLWPEKLERRPGSWASQRRSPGGSKRLLSRPDEEAVPIGGPLNRALWGEGGSVAEVGSLPIALGARGAASTGVAESMRSEYMPPVPEAVGRISMRGGLEGGRSSISIVSELRGGGLSNRVFRRPD